MIKHITENQVAPDQRQHVAEVLLRTYQNPPQWVYRYTGPRPGWRHLPKTHH